MGSRKDLIKRSLGITEYPWSSDDELEAALGPEDHHELPPESHPDAPGPSGLQSQQPLQQQQVHPQQHQPQQQQHQPQQQHQAQQQQPQTQQQLQQHHQMMQQQLLHQQQFQQLQQQQHQQQQQHHQQHNAPGAARRNQSRLDRDIFWSIINRNSTHARSRSGEMPTYVSRVNHIPAAELRERGGERAGAIDIHSLLAFKRLSRNLSSIRTRGAHLAGVIPVTRVNPGVIVPSEANSSIRINRHIPIRRFVRAGPVPITTRPDGHMVVIPGGSARAGGSRAHGRRRDPAPPQDMQRGPPPVDMPEDEVNNNPLPPTEDAGLLDDVNVEQDLPLEGEMEVEPHDNSASFSNSSAAVTEDDIVAIDLDNSDVHAQLEAQNEQEEREEQEDQEVQAERDLEANAPPAVDIDMPSTSDATDAAVTEQPSRVSRRRRPEETPEPYTVKEFNQNLLRLLECPVCLEWMEPPMSQCRRGHLVCGRCRARLASCPVCRTTFSSVRNRAMEGVAEMLRYLCWHGCGREVRLRRRAPHEASCAARQYQCPAPLCAGTQPLPRAALASHFQSRHLPMLKIGRRHKFSMKVNSELHDNWLVSAMDEYFHLRIDVDIRTWGVILYVSYIGPKCDAKNYIYEVTIDGQHNQRKLVYSRTTHSDLESSSLNVSRQDCFHLTLDQALNFIRFKNRHCDAEKFLDFNVELSRVEHPTPRDDSDS